MTANFEEVAIRLEGLIHNLNKDYQILEQHLDVILKQTYDLEQMLQSLATKLDKIDKSFDTVKTSITQLRDQLLQ